MILDEAVQQELIQAAREGRYAAGYENIVDSPGVHPNIRAHAEWMAAAERLRVSENQGAFIKRMWVEGYGPNQALCYETGPSFLGDQGSSQRRSLRELTENYGDADLYYRERAKKPTK